MPRSTQQYSQANPAPRDMRFRAGVAAFAKTDNTDNVDTANRMLKGCLLCSIGEADGHDVSIEASFIDDLVAYAKKQKNGIKCNLMHNYENMGYQLGKITDIQRDGDGARGNLTIYKAADKSPRAPGMGEWLLDLVAEDPEAAMMSIRVVIAYYYQKTETGAEVKVWEYHPENGWISPNYEMAIYVKFESLTSCDVVAEGALTDAMFSSTAPTTATQQDRHWLKDFTKEFSRALQKLVGFHSGPDDVSDNVPPKDPSGEQGIDASKDADAAPSSISERSKSDTDMTKEQFDALTERLDTLDAANKTIKEENAALKLKLEAAADKQKDTDEALAMAQADIKKLDASAATEHADGGKDTGKGAKIVGFGKHHADLKAHYNLP